MTIGTSARNCVISHDSWHSHCGKDGTCSILFHKMLKHWILHDEHRYAMVTRNGTKNTDQNITLWNVLQLMLRLLLRFVTFHTTLVWSTCMESVWWTIQIMFTWLLSFWRVHLTLPFFTYHLAQTFFQTHTHHTQHRNGYGKIHATLRASRVTRL